MLFPNSLHVLYQLIAKDREDFKYLEIGVYQAESAALFLRTFEKAEYYGIDLFDQAGLAYPIRDGIPIMLADEARKLSD